MEHTQEIQPEKDYDQAGNDVHDGLVGSQETADSSCQRAKDHKDNAETRYKAEGSGQGLANAALAAARKVRNIDGQHGQKTRRNEGDDAFQKSDYILHFHTPFQYTGIPAVVVDSFNPDFLSVPQYFCRNPTVLVGNPLVC